MANAFDAFDNPVVSGARDVGTAFAIGSNSLLKMAGDLATLTTGKKTGLSQLAQENIEYLQRQKSPELVAAEQEREAAVNAEENPFYQAWSYIKKTASDPRLLATTVAETAPSAIGPGALGAGARVATGKLLAKKGAEFATKAGVGTAIGAGTAMQAADVGGDQFDELLRTMESMDDDTAMQIPQVADLVQNKGATIPEAKGAVALELARKTALGAGAVSAVSQMVPGGRTIERALVGKTEKAAAPSIARAALAGLKGAAGEATQESIEEGGGQTLKNILARAVEPEREAMAGVGPAVGQAVIGAGALGGMAGVTQGRPSRPEPTPRPVPASQVEAGISDETPAPAATKPSLAAEQQATLERSEEMTSDQFWATVNIRQARLMGGAPNPEDVRLVGDVPAPRVIIDPDVMYSAVEETQQALNDWRAKNPNAPENMVIVFDPEMLHNGFGIQGAFNQRDGSIFINAAFVSPENVGKIASHEWAHATLASPEGQRAFAEFAAREIPQEDLDALATRYGTQDRMVLLEEWIAENQEKAPGVISRIVARIREWLSQFGIIDLNDQEVADIMLRNLREQSEGKIQPDTQRVEGGIAPDQNLEVYETFIGNRLDAGPKFALQKLPTAADITDAKGNLRYTIPKKTLDVSHYSFVPDLTEVDPAYYGTGRGEHYHRMMKGINKSFFFVGNSKPKAHENVAGKGMNRYRTTIDSSRIYDMDKDPLDLWFAPNPQKSEGLLKELGYDGFLAKTDDGRSFVALFYPTSLETGEVTRAAQPVEEEAAEEPQETAEEYLARIEREEAAERRRFLRRASQGKFSLTQEPERISGIMASPSITDIQYDRAKRNLTSANQARFKSQITDYAPDADIFDAVGDWVDGAENSVAAIFRDRKPVDELQRLAAKAGLAGDQKAVLWWSTDPKGVDAIHEIVWPKGVSMDDARQAMIDVGLENRTLIQTPDGIRGFVFDQGRQNLNKIEALHEHETQPSLDSSPASGDFLGSWSSRAEGRRAYRRVLGSTPQTETGAGELRSEQVGTGGEPETRFSLAQTKTPEFKAWFGDSQIVDADGNPQVMYHGSAFRLQPGSGKITRLSDDFTAFKPDRRGLIFTSPDPEFASKFAREYAGMGGEYVKGARVYPMFVKAENPFDYENPAHVQKIFGDKDGLNTSDLTYGFATRGQVLDGNYSAIEALTPQIKDAGFDGLYVSEGDAKNLAVFSPDQLKSATGNVGAFGQRPVTAEEAERMGLTEEEAAEEQRRGDIRFSLAQTKTPEFRRWFKESVATDENGRPQVYYHGTPNFSGTAFKPSKAINRTGNVSGYYFTPDAEESSFYATGEEGAQVIPVYLSIQNPFIPGKSKISLEMTDQYRTELENANTHLDPSNSWFNSKITNMVKTGTVSPNALNGDGDAYQRVLKAGGYDGFQDGRHLVAFEPTQIKSSIGNLGTFDPENPDFRYSLTEEPVEKTRTEEVEEPVLEEGDEGYEEPVDTSSILNAAAKREREELPPTSALNTLYAKQSAVPLPVTGKRTNGQVAEQLRQAAREYWGRELNSGNLTPDELDRIVGNAVEEVIAGLKAKNHAGNWYTTAIRKAMAIARVIHPELGDDALARKAGFDDAHAAEVGLAMAMAITSQNLNVEKNTEYANDQFNILKNTGRFDPSKEYGSKLEAISGNLQLANVLLDRVGWKGVEDFLNREYTVKQLNEIASEVLGKPISISGKVDDVVNGSAIFGPKIGAGFFQNLRGNFNPVTVDLWMRRTWGRWTGDVLPEPLDANRLARMLVGMREGGIQLPEELRSIRTVIAKKGRKVPTLTEDTAERVLSNPEAVNAAYDFAALHDSRWNKIYSEVRQNITPEQAEAVRNGSMSLEQLNRQQQKSIREKQEAWQDLEDRPSVSTKEGKKAQKKFFEEIDREAGRTEKLSNEELSQFKPEWAKAARVIRTLLKPIDAPSDIDRRTIVDVVNRVRSELDRQGINATNADIQAILWYPEKDLWAKLAGKPESKLKSSYDEEFLRVAEARGLGEQARNAAAEVGN